MLSYFSFQEIVEEATKQGKKISDIILHDQALQLNRPEEVIYQQMEASFDVMIESTHAGADPNLRSASSLTGGEGDVYKRQGLRNGYLLAVAPTSSTSIIAGTSPGVDPIMNRFYYDEKKNGLIPRVAPDLSLSNYVYYNAAHQTDQSWSCLLYTSTS